MPVEPAARPPSPPALPARPVALAYDELPAGSDLRREYHGDGAVTITSPAGEPSTAVRRSAAQRQALASAVFTCVVMAGSFWALWSQFTRLDAALRATVLGLLVVVFGGVFLLAWRVWYGTDLDLLTKARSETVVLHADARGLLGEIAGPLGDRSIEVPANSLGRISVVGWRRGAVVIPHLRLERPGEPMVLLFAGRHPGELDWIAATLRQVLRQDEA